MTTTDEFQKNPDFFTQKTEIKSIRTNPRYSNFFQTHFTAGDIDQFETYRDKTNGSNPLKEIVTHDNIWSSFEKLGEHIDWKKYESLTTESVDQTFLYLFEKFKKGIFVKIKDNKLSVFLPFSKHNYINEWGNRMIQPPNFRTMQDFLVYASKLQGYSITPDKVNKFTNKWYANNCLIRTEFPLGEMDRGVSNLKDMLLTLCAEREVPDIELFFNRRDFPLIKIDDTEPYDHIFDQNKFPLLSHKYDKYCPILSMVTTDTNADIPFPTMEDWARANNNKLFAPDFKSYDFKFDSNWEQKIPTAVFRGSSTGCGVTIDTNPRLKLAYMSINSPIEDGIPLLNAGITKWNCRPRKISKERFLQVIDPSKMPFQLASFLSPVEQSHYKYIINVDGHVSAFRISLELSSGSVLLLQESKYRVWFSKYLIPMVHYIPIKEDLSDLFDKIRWCRMHDAECKEITVNAKLFYDTYLSKKGILDYAQLLFINIKKVTGTYFYNYGNVGDLIYQKQLELIPKVTDILNCVYPFEKRDVNAMAGFKMFLSKHQIQIDKMQKIHETKDSIIHTSQIDKLTLNSKKSTRTHELINETFIGLNCINKLLKEIPNFKYTFGFQNDVLYTEHIDGILFSDYIKKCSIFDLASVLQLIFLTLSVAQERCGFVHNDLTCWNIIIQELKVPTRIVYQFGDQIFEVNTSILPIIIDYDRSHAIYKDFHYGIIHPFKTSTVQDCFCIVVNSLHEFCSSQKFGDDILKELLYMANFLSETEFHPVKLTNFIDLIEFLLSNKKYNEIVYRNKCDLETFKPFDFLMYFSKMTSSKKIVINHIDGMKVFKDHTFVNPLFYYNIISSKENRNDIFEYINRIEHKVKYELDELTFNFIYYVDASNRIYHVMNSLLQFLEKYNKGYEIEIRNCKRVLATLRDKMHYKKLLIGTPLCGHNESIKSNLFCTVCNRVVETKKLDSKLLLSVNFNPPFSIAKYTPTTFSIPSKILTILQGNVDLKSEISINIWYMIRDTLLFVNPFVIPNEEEFGKKYGILLSNMSPLAILNHNATIKTLRWISSSLYKIDVSRLPPSKQLKTIQSILALC